MGLRRPVDLSELAGCLIVDCGVGAILTHSLLADAHRTRISVSLWAWCEAIAGCRFLENGWNHWYRGHSVVDGLRVDLLRLRAGRLDSFPMLDAVVANVAKMTREETNRLLEQLRAAQDNRV